MIINFVEELGKDQFILMPLIDLREPPGYVRLLDTLRLKMLRKRRVKLTAHVLCSRAQAIEGTLERGIQ